MKDSEKSGRIDKYAAIEIIFFIAYFFLFPVLTDIEYNLKEQPCQQCEQSFLINLINRFVFGLFQVFPFVVLYKVILHKLLLKKKYLLFIAGFILFLFGLDLYIVYVEYWTISQLTFLPKYITESAGKWFHARQFFHFSIIYVINQTLVFTALAYFINYAKQEEKMNALKQAKLEADLIYLKAQLQPHFFFNTLNNIYSLAQDQSVATAPLVARLSEMMRYIIYETDKEKGSLQKEIDFLKNYVEVESVRYNDKISINFDTQGITGEAVIEPLLLLPFIENMFKHGAQEETGKGFIDIVICLTAGELILQAKNSKPSLHTGKPVAPGIGLTNVVKRLKLLYPGKHSLTMNENENFYEVLLNVELS